MIKINRIEIAKFNPCKARFDNYVEHYGDRDFAKRQFMGLKNITHEDKLWVAFRMMTQKQASDAAADIARLVLGIYESKYPGDSRVRDCIDAIKLYNDGKISVEEFQRKRCAANAVYATYAAATAATYAAATAIYATAATAINATAINAAANAINADDAATAATYAAATAIYATAATAIYAAANAINADDAADADAKGVSAREAHEKKQRTIVLKYWK